MLEKNVKNTYIKIRKIFKIIQNYNKQKIFCIGLNKTGTTSLRRVMVDLKFVVGNQRDAELLFDDWVKRDFSSLVKYCRTAEFFQDAPFSFPYTYIAIDQAYPDSKFILTVRDNEEQWYNSLIRFHGKMWGNGNVPPTVEDLKKGNYIYPGFPYYGHFKLFSVKESNHYDKATLINFYLDHNKNVIEYFRHRKDDLLILNVSEDGAYQKLVEFLDIETDNIDFPWENKTKDS